MCVLRWEGRERMEDEGGVGAGGKVVGEERGTGEGDGGGREEPGADY